MPTWSDILSEVTRAGSTHDVVRRQYLKKLAAKTKRNVIIYYSGWLQKAALYRANAWDFVLNDADKNGLMATIHEMIAIRGLTSSYTLPVAIWPPRSHSLITSDKCLEQTLEPLSRKLRCREGL